MHAWKRTRLIRFPRQFEGEYWIWGARAETVQRVEEAFLVELASVTDAALIAHDSEARKYCRLAGAKDVALAKRNCRAFRNTIKKLGFIIPDVRLSS
jgi:hypothetical protein